MKYKIQHRISTLAHNAVMDREKEASFMLEEILFHHGNFNMRDGWREDFWIAETTTEALNWAEAINSLINKLNVIIPRTSLIAQSYIEFTREPFLITREDSVIGIFRYVKNVEGGGLMFMEDELKALEILVNNHEIPKEFYFYWNDAVNTYGYSSKLLLMFSAIESLVKKESGDKDIEKINLIFGEELANELFQQKTGLRHRLTHGEYFNSSDGKNYLDIIHKKVINYFNKVILKHDYIQENVVNPQRHFFGNKEEMKAVIKPLGNSSLDLLSILKDFDENGINDLKNYELIHDRSITLSF